MIPTLLVLSLSTAQPAVPTVEDVERRALAARQSIRSGYFHYRIRTEEHVADGRTVTGDWKVWLDGTKHRVDIVEDNPNLTRFNRARHVGCRNCEQPGHTLNYIEIPNVGATLRPTGRGVMDTNAEMIDPRVVGYAAAFMNTLARVRVDHLVGRHNRGEPTIAPAADRPNCWLISYPLIDRVPQVRVSIWIDPTKGYNVVKAQSTEGPPGPRLVTTGTSELVVGPSGLWYPKSYLYERTVEGKLTEREVTEVVEARVNDPVPAEVFTLRGVGMRDGTPVSMPNEARDSGVWQDGRLVPEREYRSPGRVADVELPPEPIDPNPQPRYWLFVLAGTLVVAAVALLARAIRRRATG